MNAYAIYRITETIRIMLFMVSAILIYNFYPITAVMIIMLALLNDLPILTIAKDNTWLSPVPVRWDMHKVLTVATVLGVVGVMETFLLLILAKNHFHVSLAELQTIIFLGLLSSECLKSNDNRRVGNQHRKNDIEMVYIFERSSYSSHGF